MHFFVKDLKSGLISGLDADHFFVMRVKEGDEVKISDLSGGVAWVKIQSVDKKERKVFYNILKLKSFEKQAEKVLLQAKTDKNYLEKMVEILPLVGINKIIVFNSDYSEKLQKINFERLEKILIRTCEQGEILFKPEIIFEEKNLAEILKVYSAPTVLDLPENYPHVEKLSTNLNKNVVLVGPEGGWSDKERRVFNDFKVPIFSLGNTVFPAWMAGYTFFAKN